MCAVCVKNRLIEPDDVAVLEGVAGDTSVIVCRVILMSDISYNAIPACPTTTPQESLSLSHTCGTSPHNNVCSTSTEAVAQQHSNP